MAILTQAERIKACERVCRDLSVDRMDTGADAAALSAIDRSLEVE